MFVGELEANVVPFEGVNYSEVDTGGQMSGQGRLWMACPRGPTLRPQPYAADEYLGSYVHVHTVILPVVNTKKSF